MSPRTQQVFTCSNCDAQYPKWVGRCSQCGKFGTVATTPSAVASVSRRVTPLSASATTVSLAGLTSQSVQRTATGFAEVDRVLGGGLAHASITLLSGEPGVGKSTLLLALANKATKALYISGEESAEQVAGRLKRLSLTGKSIAFSSTTDITAIAQTVRVEHPDIVVIDSLQTMSAGEFEASSASPTKLRAVVAELVAVAKETGVAVVLIGHVTKEGVAAGPKAIEHLVDVVLTLEGAEHQELRFLHAAKNRFGPTDEVGVFQMNEQGLKEVSNPSALFLAERHQGAGSCVTAVVEGSRALLIELQALVARSHLTYPKRATTGFDVNRLQVLLAVLGERAQVRTNFSDVYINLAGGFRSREPALDLAVCAAVVSATYKAVLPKDVVIFGEVGLGGEVRPVTGMERRLSEAARLGFKQALIPVLPESVKTPKGLALACVHSVAEAVDWVKH